MTSVAAAQSAGEEVLARGIDPVVNKLSPSLGSYLTLAGAGLAPARSYQLGLWADYNYGLLAYQLGDDKLGDLIRHRLDLHLMGAFALTDWLEIGLDVPVTAWQAHGFEELEEETGFTATAPSSAGLGDIRLLGRAGLLRDPEGPLLAAAVVELRGLSGDGDSFVGERQLVIFPRLALEREVLGLLRLSAELGYRYRSKAGQYLNIYVGDEWAGGLGARLALPGSTPLQNALLAELLVSTPARAAFTFSSADSLKTPIEALLGFQSRLADEFYLTVGLGRGVAVTPGYGRAAARAFASIRYQSELLEAAPEPVEGDRDHDGLMDSLDRCPDEPGLVELDGCPDRDNDAIPDIQDRCPDDKGVPKLDGCPPNQPVAVFEEGGLTLFGTISFDSGKATLKAESFEVVDTVAALLLAHPEIVRIRVDGHTDDVGKAATNLDLSERRAAAVVDYLVNEGVARGRLDSKGFGESEPVDSNATALGRAKNRRVVFTVLESGEPEPTKAATPATPSR